MCQRVFQCVRRPAVATLALVAALSASSATAQDHVHPREAPRKPSSPLPPTAKKLNEGHKVDCERFADLVFVAESYHHFEFPKEMLQQIRKALKPDGLLVIVDLERVEGVSLAYVLDMVRAGKGTFTGEIRNEGFELIEEVDVPNLDLDYVLKFKLRESLVAATPPPR